MAIGDYRGLGLNVPIAEALDPAMWRRRYAFGTPSGRNPSSPAEARRARLGEGVLARSLAGTMTEDDLDAVAAAVAALPDDTIRWHLKAAASELELKLGIQFGIEVLKADPIDPGLVEGVHFDRRVGRLPYSVRDANQWFKIDAPWPIISVQRIRAFYYGQPIWSFTATDSSAGIRVEWPRQGATHVLPVELQGLLINPTTGAYGPWHSLRLSRDPVPDVWAIDCTTGPVGRDGSVGTLPAALVNWIYAAAGIPIMSLSGMSQSKGLSSSSISMDGVSRSVGLQASAIYGINSATEHVFEEITKRIDWKGTRTQIRGIRILPYGA